MWKELGWASGTWMESGLLYDMLKHCEINEDTRSIISGLGSVPFHSEITSHSFLIEYTAPQS